MAVIGKDCHITLQHEDVNLGAACGFILDPQSKNRPESVEIKREIFSEPETLENIWVWFDVLLADHVLGPDGGVFEDESLILPGGGSPPASRMGMYTKLMAFLEKDEGITLSFGLGSITGLGALGFTTVEKHYAEYSSVRIELNNTGKYYGIINTQALVNSVWDGSLTWETSYWR